MENTAIPKIEYEPQTKEQNAYFAALRREEEAEHEAEDFASQIAAQHQVLAGDINAIRQKYPDETAQNVGELGMEYVNLCACGMSAIAAYERVREKQTSVPFIGDVSTEYAAEKDYFTKAEVEGMSKQEIKKNYTKIRNSMEKW